MSTYHHHSIANIPSPDCTFCTQLPCLCTHVTTDDSGSCGGYLCINKKERGTPRWRGVVLGDDGWDDSTGGERAHIVALGRDGMVLWSRRDELWGVMRGRGEGEGWDGDVGVQDAMGNHGALGQNLNNVSTGLSSATSEGLGTTNNQIIFGEAQMNVLAISGDRSRANNHGAFGDGRMNGYGGESLANSGGFYASNSLTILQPPQTHPSALPTSSNSRNINSANHHNHLAQSSPIFAFSTNPSQSRARSSYAHPPTYHPYAMASMNRSNGNFWSQDRGGFTYPPTYHGRFASLRPRVGEQQVVGYGNYDGNRDFRVEEWNGDDEGEGGDA